MAEKVFGSFNQLEIYLKKQIDDVLNKEVAIVVKEQIQVAVDEVVYQSGEPLVYERRGSNQHGGMGNPLGTGSLADISKMKHIVKNGILEVTDEAERNMDYRFAGVGYDLSKSLTENIVMGYGSKDRWYNEPRDFIGQARENLRQDKYHVEALKEGLMKHGLEVL